MANNISLGKNGKFGEIDFSKLKSGITKEDLGIKEGTVLDTIFDSINTNKNGQSENKLDRNELNEFIKKIRILCDPKSKGDTNLSEKESKKFQLNENETLGRKNKTELINFLSKLSELTDGVKEVKQHEKSELVTFEDGHTEEIFPDGKVITTVIDKAKGTKTVTTIDADGNEKIEKTESTEEGEVVTISQNGRTVSKTIDYKKPKIHEEYTYENGKAILKKRVNSETNETIIYNGIEEILTKEENGTKITIIKEYGRTKTEVKTRTNESNQTEVTQRKYDGNNYNETTYIDGRLKSQTKLVDGKEYSLNYDEKGNTLGIIVQNGETIKGIAETFGVEVTDLIKANSSKIKGKYPNAYFNVGEEIKIPRQLEADDTVLQDRKTKEEAIAEYHHTLEIQRQRAKEARMRKQTVIAKGNNGYYVTKDGYGNIRYFDSDKKEISAEEFKEFCPNIYKSITETQGAEKRGATKRTKNKYDINTIRQEAGQLAEKIHNQIIGASINEKTINLLRAITTENVAFVISEYQRKYGVSLAKDIDEEWGLDLNTVKEHICKKLVDQAKSLGIEGIYYGDYQKINDLNSLQNWINNASSKIISHMTNAKETYYATEAEETQRTQQAENKKIAKTSAEQIVYDLLKATEGWNDIDTIKSVISRIDTPEELKEVNRLLAIKGYPPTDKYSAIENFIYLESNHDPVQIYNSSNYLEQTVQKWIDNGVLKGQEANEAQARMATRVLYDGGDGFGTDCEKIKKAVRMIRCPKPTGDRARDNAQAREVYRLVNAMINKHNTFYGLGSPCKDLLDYCEGEMWDSEVKYLKGILAETNAIQGKEKAQAISDLTEEAVSGAGTDIEYLEQAIRAIDSPEDRKAVEAKLKVYCEKKGIKPQIAGQAYLQAILYDECDTFMGISRDHKEIRKFNEMLIEQGAYTKEEIINLRAEQATLQILEGDFDNIKDAITQIKDPKVLAKIEQLLKIKNYNSIDEFLSKKLDQTKSDLINAELASNNLLPEEKAANVAFRLIKNSDFDNRAMGIRAIRNEKVAKMVDQKLKAEGSSLAKVMQQFNKEKTEYKKKAEFWDGLGKFLIGVTAEIISDNYKENTDYSDNMFVETDNAQQLTEEQKNAYKMTVQLMERKLEQMKKDYQRALDSQGIVSSAINIFCEQYGIGTTREEIEARIEHDTETIRLLKLAAEGKLGKMVDGTTVSVSFEEVFAERQVGTNFNIESIKKVQQQAERLVAMNYAKDNIATCWQELNDGLVSLDIKRLSVAIIDTLEKLSKMTGKELSLAGYGYSVKDSIIVDNSGNPVSVEKLKGLANQLKQGLSDIAKDLLGSEIPLNTSPSKINEFLEDSYQSKKESFKQEFKDAFGQDCPDEMVDDYISTIETGKMVTNMAVLIGAAIAAPFTMGGSLAAFLGVSSGTAGMIAGGISAAIVSIGMSALEHSTDADGWTNAEWTSDAEQAMWDGILTALGMKVGMIADAKAMGAYKIAAQSFLKKIVPNISAKTLDRASVCIARVRAMGYEVSSDTIQSLAQTYCQYGEFDEEAFVRDLLMSVAGNTAGHVVGAVGDVKGAKTGADADVPKVNDSENKKLPPPGADKPKYEIPESESSFDKATRNGNNPNEVAPPRSVGKLSDEKFNEVAKDLEAKLADIDNLNDEQLARIQQQIDALQNRRQRRALQNLFDEMVSRRTAGKAPKINEEDVETPKADEGVKVDKSKDYEPKVDEEVGVKEPKPSIEDPVKAQSLRKKLGEQLFAIYQSIERGIETLKDATGYNKLKTVITTKFKNSPTELSELLTKLNNRARKLGLNIIETATDRTARMGKRLSKYYTKIENAINSMTDMKRFNKLLDKITTKFVDFKDDMKTLLDKLYARAKSIGLKLNESLQSVYAKNGIKAEGVNPLDKYTRSKKGIQMSKSHSAWMKSRKDLFDNMHDYPGMCWRGYTPADQHHGAWKMHLFSVSEADWREMCDVIIPYLRERGVEWKTFNADYEASYLNGSKQQGKAFTIYPKNNEDMAQIAKDLDYIIRKNKLETTGSHITGDNQMGSTGRLFYRYEFNSGAYKNDILDLGNEFDYAEYDRRYDSNRGEGKYLADDMTLEDDIWRNFDPSDPNAKPADSASSSHSYVKKECLQKGQPYEIQGSAKLNLANTVEVDLNNPKIKSRIDKLPEGERLTIGRSGDIKIDDPTGLVSRVHVILEKRNGKIYVIDNSTNGTTVKTTIQTGNYRARGNTSAGNIDPKKAEAYAKFDKNATPIKTPENGFLNQNSQYILDLNNMPALRILDGTIVDLNRADIINRIKNLKEGEYITLGRNGDIVISNSRSVSRHHLVITKQKN